MRSPIDLLLGRINGYSKRDITRRTVPCYKYVLEPEGEKLEVCLLVDSRYLYRFPYEKARGARGLAIKTGFLAGKMEDLRLREFQPGICRYVNSDRTEKATA